MVSGSRSPRKVLPLRDEIKRRLLADPGTPGYVREAKFAHALDSWATAEAVLELVTAALSEAGIEAGAAEVTDTAEESTEKGGKGSRRSRQERSTALLDNFHRATTRAANARKELGLSPASYAGIARDVGYAFKVQEDAVTSMAAAVAGIRARREAAIAAGEPWPPRVELPPAG